MFKKQIFLALCFSCTLFFTNAQDSIKTSTITYLDKGTWLLGGNLSYLNVTTTYNSPNSGFGGQFGSPGFGNLTPTTEGLFLGSISAAKMLNSYFAVGGKVTYINSSGKDAAFLGPTLRIYINNEGKTIIVVTHEPDVAAQTKRNVILKDGIIESDEFNKQLVL